MASPTSPVPPSSNGGGFFNTFSLHGPSYSGEAAARAQAAVSRAPQKRNRRVFVCLPCHNRKLRCDKALPACGRCVAAGAAGECRYSKPAAAGKAAREPEKGGGSGAAAARGSGDALDYSGSGHSSPKIGGGETGNYARGSVASSYSGAARGVGMMHHQMEDEDAVEAREVSCYKTNEGRARVSKTSHWVMVSAEFEEAIPFLFGKHPQWAARFEELKALKWLFPMLKTGNFPFGNACPFKSTRAQVIANLPNRAVVEALARNYLATVERTHRLLHGPQFLAQLDAFFAAVADDTTGAGRSGNAAVDAANAAAVATDGWLAQLLLMLALSCQTAPAGLLAGTGKTVSQWTDGFLDDAELCFSRSPYLSMPDLTTVRVLAMAVLCKQLELVTQNDTFQCFVLMGMLVRLAMAMQMHRSATRLFPAMPLFEAEMRSRAWHTIVLLDADVSLASGMSSIPVDYDADPPRNVDDADIFPHVDDADWGRARPVGGPAVSRVSGPSRGSRGAHRVDDDMHAVRFAVPRAVGSPAVRPLAGIGAGSVGEWEAMFNNNNNSGDYTEGSFQAQLAGLLPLVAEIVNAVNAVSSPYAVPYDRVLRWDGQLRRRLADAALCFNLGRERRLGRQVGGFDPALGIRGFSHMGSRIRCEKVSAQLGLFEVLVRRTLLALHHPYAYEPGPGYEGAAGGHGWRVGGVGGRNGGRGNSSASSAAAAARRYARSRAAVLESSMALLTVQQLWSEAFLDGSSTGGIAVSGSTVGREMTSDGVMDGGATGGTGAAAPSVPQAAGTAAQPGSKVGWLIDLCKDDFKTAMIYVILGLRRNEFPPDAISTMTSFGGGGADDMADLFAPAAASSSSASSSAASDLASQPSPMTDPTTVASGPTTATTGGGDDVGLESLPTATAARAALAAGIAIMRQRATRSATQFREYMGVSILLHCLAVLERRREVGHHPRRQQRHGPGEDYDDSSSSPSSSSSPHSSADGSASPRADDGDMLEALLRLADEIETVVVTGRQDLWSGTTLGGQGGGGAVVDPAISGTATATGGLGDDGTMVAAPDGSGRLLRLADLTGPEAQALQEYMNHQQVLQAQQMGLMDLDDEFFQSIW